MKSIRWLAAILGSSATLSIGTAESASAADQQVRNDILVNWAQVQQYLVSPEYFRNYTIRVYYLADCRFQNGVFHDPALPPPIVKGERPTKGETGLIAARHIFRNASDVRVSEDPDRIIRIRIGNVPTAVLKTKIRIIKMDDSARSTKLGAIRAILKTREMQTAMKSLKPNVPSYFSSETGITPPPYHAQMKNVTFDQALDVIAKSWDRIVVYGVCAEPDEYGTTVFDIDAGNRVEMKEF